MPTNNTDTFAWLFTLHARVPAFLERLRSPTKPGFYHYSLSGDLYDENIHWGLGNATFALKIFYTMGLLDTLPAEQKRDIAAFITSFEQPGGYLFDPLVARRAWLREKAAALRHGHFNNFWHLQTKIAETRQAVSSLKLINQAPRTPYQNFPITAPGVIAYLEKLQWAVPWEAASHFSHLLFFLHNSTRNNKGELIQTALAWITTLQHPTDGSWYRGSPSVQQKINGAMKVITGLKVVGHQTPEGAEALIDLCLAAANDTQACDNFNIVYVLHFAHRAIPTYRPTEIQDFLRRRLQIYYDRHYYPAIGGFSFLPHRANQYYYGAKISQGKNEPDIHGTVLFLWGITMIAQLLDLNDELRFQEIIP